MKLVLITVVEQFESDIMRLLKTAKIDSFSESHIDGFKKPASLLMTSNWFPTEKGGVKSSLFFSFTEADKIDTLFALIEDFNTTLETSNPIKAIVVPIEKYI